MIARIFIMLSLFATLAACNTMEGIGRDIKGAGSALEGTASRSR